MSVFRCFEESLYNKNKRLKQLNKVKAWEQNDKALIVFVLFVNSANARKKKRERATDGRGCVAPCAEKKTYSIGR